MDIQTRTLEAVMAHAKMGNLPFFKGDGAREVLAITCNTSIAEILLDYQGVHKHPLKPHSEDEVFLVVGSTFDVESYFNSYIEGMATNNLLKIYSLQELRAMEEDLFNQLLASEVAKLNE